MAFPYSEGSDYVESLLSARLLFMESVFSWYAVYTAARAEKKVKERLDQNTGCGVTGKKKCQCL